MFRIAWPTMHQTGRLTFKSHFGVRNLHQLLACPRQEIFSGSCSASHCLALPLFLWLLWRWQWPPEHIGCASRNDMRRIRHTLCHDIWTFGGVLYWKFIIRRSRVHVGVRAPSELSVRVPIKSVEVAWEIATYLTPSYFVEHRCMDENWSWPWPMTAASAAEVDDPCEVTRPTIFFVRHVAQCPSRRSWKLRSEAFMVGYSWQEPASRIRVVQLPCESKLSAFVILRWPLSHFTHCALVVEVPDEDRTNASHDRVAEIKHPGYPH